MSLDPSVGEQELLAETIERDAKALEPRQRVAELLVSTAFLASCAILFVVRPPHALAVLPALLCVLILALSTRVRFRVSSGFTVPTQLAFLPLVFTVPVAIAPLAVVLALTLARVPDVVAGRTVPGRLLHCVGNSWFAVGPAAVFAASGSDPSHAAAAVLLAALAAQFAVDFCASTVRIAVVSHMRFRDQLREGWVYAGDAALSPVALVVAQEVHRTPLVALALVPLLGVLAVLAREREARMKGLLELKSAYHGTALVLGDVVEADDGYTGDHCRGVVSLAVDIGEHLKLGAERLRNLEFGALLHDVGKIAIPKEIINKPGKLDPYEWTVIKTHTIEGQRMLEQVGGFMREVGLIVRSHHERWDGTGYPDGLAGDAIPLESRIIACCDSWNAMRTDRAYRQAMTEEVAMAEMVGNAGRQFDPGIVEALLAIVRRERLDLAGPGRARTPGQAGASPIPATIAPQPITTRTGAPPAR